MAGSPDKLAEYKARRDFDRTSEPAGAAGETRAEGLSFVVQKHDASRLHYDFRLEWEGVLLSWAVTKGPSDDPGQKRLAVRTEDHPLEYGDFEGVIPKGQYGGGTVMLWDRGTWTPEGDVAKGLKSGKLSFTLHGGRMKGGWALVRMRGGEKRENWLLIKERDAYAGEDADALTEDHMTSVETGREMQQIAEKEAAQEMPGDKDRPDRKKARPKFRKPQLATLVDAAPEGDDWIHETKFDGYRCLAAIGKGGTRLYTRSGKDWTDRFAALEDAFADLPCDAALIDGEVMAAKVSGSAFSSLQKALSNGDPLVFFAFDLLHLDGEDMTGAPQIERREALADLLSGAAKDGALRMSEHVTGQGPEIFERACAAGAEGIISKRADASYRGTRTKAWRKVKCTKRQEFVIGGWSPSDKDRPFASLLLGTCVDMPTTRLYLFDPATAPSELRGLIGGKIREGIIVQNWPGVLRAVATMVTGVMAPSQLLKKFAAYPRQHELAVALREIGRIERTLFIIEWLIDADMQRRAQVGLNKGEAHHALKNALRIGRQGEIRDRTTEGQHYRMAGLNLLAAIIIYWNTKHLGQAVAARQRVRNRYRRAV